MVHLSAKMIQQVEFRNIKHDFQSKMNYDLKEMGTSNNLFVFADKTNNIYELPVHQYEKLLKENITKSYQKCDVLARDNINKEAKKIAESLNLDSKMEGYANRNAYITIKDHKPNFPHNIKCRLINPAKSEMGIVSKKYLENILKSILNSTRVNQWRNTSTVINWFETLQTNENSRFIKFDIVDFYPSISEQLLQKTITYAKTIVYIEDSIIDIIKHSRKSLLFEKSSTWVKKGNELFDVTMGSYGAEICELVGLYLLEKLSKRIGKEHVGLYRDDGLAAIIDANGPKMDRLRKDIISLFQEEGLSITIDTNLIETDFLDVSFNIVNKKYRPFRKPGNDPLYVHVKSNHPKAVINQIPSMINKRICETSCDEQTFNNAKGQYEAALAASGYQPNMSYNKQPKRQRNRTRKIIWFPVQPKC